MACSGNDCIKSFAGLGKGPCKDCNKGCKGDACSEENMAYFWSQEFLNKVLANVKLNDLKTTDKSLVGALLELNHQLDLKQDHSDQLDAVAALPANVLETFIQHLQVLG